MKRMISQKMTRLVFSTREDTLELDSLTTLVQIKQGTTILYEECNKRRTTGPLMLEIIKSLLLGY